HCSASTPKKCLPTGSASTPPRSRACVRTASSESEALAAGPPDLCRRAASAAHAGGRPRPRRGLNSADPAALNSRGPDHADIPFLRPERVTQRSTKSHDSLAEEEGFEPLVPLLGSAQFSRHARGEPLPSADSLRIQPS